jgi:hypothetical protein
MSQIGTGAGNKNKAAAVSSSTSNVAVSTASAAATAGSTLKRLNIRGDRPLVIELLSDKQEAVRPPAGAFRVWVQHLLNPLAPEEVGWCVRAIIVMNNNTLTFP